MNKDKADKAMILSQKLQDILHGQDPDIVGGALADVVSLWIAGHQGTPGAGVEEEVVNEYRESVLEDWINVVRRLIPVSDAIVKHAIKKGALSYEERLDKKPN